MTLTAPMMSGHRLTFIIHSTDVFFRASLNTSYAAAGPVASVLLSNATVSDAPGSIELVTYKVSECYFRPRSEISVICWMNLKPVHYIADALHMNNLWCSFEIYLGGHSIITSRLFGSFYPLPPPCHRLTSCWPPNNYVTFDPPRLIDSSWNNIPKCGVVINVC